MATESPSKTWKERLLYTQARDDRSRMVAVVNNAILHLHPSNVPAPAIRFTYTWGLGGIATVLAAMLGLTGLLLMFRYDARVDYAYTSIQVLEAQVMFGSLFRAVHHWSANLLVVTAFLHLLRVTLHRRLQAGPHDELADRHRPIGPGAGGQLHRLPAALGPVSLLGDHGQHDAAVLYPAHRRVAEPLPAGRAAGRPGRLEQFLRPARGGDPADYGLDDGLPLLESAQERRPFAAAYKRKACGSSV